MTTFDTAVSEVLRQEGGYTNDPHDPGGETNFGIDKRSHPDVDIRNLTEDAARVIYKREYWDKSGCEHLPTAVAIQVFDAAVNQGVGTAIRMLQEAIGKVQVDGVLGPRTLAAAADPRVVTAFAARRILRYASGENFGRYGRGWVNRAVEVLKLAIDEGNRF